MADTTAGGILSWGAGKIFGKAVLFDLEYYLYICPTKTSLTIGEELLSTTSSVIYEEIMDFSNCSTE